MPNKKSAPRILHCHSTFAAGGKELRAVKLMNAFGKSLDHTIISGEPDEKGARALINRTVPAHFPTRFPSLKGWPTPGRLVAIAKAISDYDLVLTYNFGAMDVVMAHTVFGEALSLPPLIHHEDGFNEDEASELKTRRNWYRRIATGRTHAMVVPSRTLEKIAVETWKQPPARVQRIPNGIDTKAFGKRPKPGGFRVVKREGERWIGTLAGLRPVKQLDQLVKACADLPENWHLVILGDGPEKDAIRAAADAHEISHRVHLPGDVEDPAKLIGMFDIFALSSKSEQFPISVVEAMAAGLPVAAPDVGDVKSIVAEANRPFIAAPDSTDALAAMLSELVANEALRADIGAANKAKAREQYDEAQMIEAYRSLYWGALGRDA
ncbi:glycosyl transferase group 1 [Erythrobacter sp. NAP1]|uniref:glycosyltransferase family 4 protein n=1 Tax=Erythrobacter sp. NAP1 TaxID=237727 RepID=UPI0000686F55|nr:glycosyltransferase family 4 protein [Erythrobacter sp. NAP1]EAQ29543.1 glycosyl transferase group 1 [Erythrobacter sp. NAP1]